MIFLIHFWKKITLLYKLHYGWIVWKDCMWISLREDVHVLLQQDKTIRVALSSQLRYISDSSDGGGSQQPKQLNLLLRRKTDRLLGTTIFFSVDATVPATIPSKVVMKLLDNHLQKIKYDVYHTVLKSHNFSLLFGTTMLLPVSFSLLYISIYLKNMRCMQKTPEKVI